MVPVKNSFLILKIKYTINNTFLTLLNLNGTLFLSYSLGHTLKNTFKSTLLNKLLLVIQRIKELNIDSVYLYIKNLSVRYTFYIIKILMSWKIHVAYYCFALNTPHNGCRNPHKSRRRRRRFKKQIIPLQFVPTKRFLPI